MPILASEALPRENKESQVKNFIPSGNRTWASHNLVQLDELDIYCSKSNITKQFLTTHFELIHCFQ